MSGMRLLALGVGNAFSSRYYSSSFALEADGQWLLIDCPHPIRKIIREGADVAGCPLRIEDLAGVVLTHLHADHVSDLEGLLFYHRFVIKRKPTVIAHPDVADRLWSGHLAAGMEWSVEELDGAPVRHAPEDYYENLGLSEDQPLRFGPFSLLARKTIHSVPCTALKISAAGRTLGFSADTAYDPTLIEWLSPADAIFHDAGGAFPHTPYEKLLELPHDVRARMRVYHYPDRLDEAGSELELVRQGRLYAI